MQGFGEKLSYSAKAVTVIVQVTDVGKGQQVADNSILDHNDTKQTVQSMKMQLSEAHALAYKIIYSYNRSLIDTAHPHEKVWVTHMCTIL